MKMDGPVLEEKSSFKMWLSFSSELDWAFYIIFIAKTFHENCSPDLLHEVSFSCGCAVSQHSVSLVTDPL